MSIEDAPKFALGYKRDPHDSHDLPAEMSLGLHGPVQLDAVVPASLMPFRVGVLRQLRASSCVAHALCRAIDIGHRFDVRFKHAPGDPPLASRRFMYFNARRQEAVDAIKRGESPPPMADAGCYPRLAMRAVQKLGFCDEADYPYSDDPKAIVEAPDPEVYKASYDQTGFRYYRVSAVGTERVVAVSRALAQGKPVIFGMFVDSAFMRNKGAVIEAVDGGDPDGGGHMLCVVEVTSTGVVFDNWWGEDWGHGGLGTLSWKLFGSAIVTDVYVIETAPPFSGCKGGVP